MQDASFRRVKQVYWGIRVLPVEVLNLDYETSLAQWSSAGNQKNQTVPDIHETVAALVHAVRFVFRSDGFVHIRKQISELN